MSAFQGCVRGTALGLVLWVLAGVAILRFMHA